MTGETPADGSKMCAYVSWSIQEHINLRFKIKERQLCYEKTTVFLGARKLISVTNEEHLLLMIPNKLQKPVRWNLC